MAGLDPMTRLEPLVRLRDAAADLLERAERAYRAGDRAQDASSIERLRQQVHAFEERLQQCLTTLHDADDHRRTTQAPHAPDTSHAA